MLDALMNPGDMTQDQWLIIGILFILACGILYFLYRTYRVIRDSSKNRYKPNIGLSRMEDQNRADSDSRDT